MEACQNMHMIGSSVDAVQMALFVFDDSRSVTIEILTQGVGQKRGAIFCGKDDVINDLRVG